MHLDTDCWRIVAFERTTQQTAHEIRFANGTVTDKSDFKRTNR